MMGEEFSIYRKRKLRILQILLQLFLFLFLLFKIIFLVLILHCFDLSRLKTKTINENIILLTKMIAYELRQREYTCES
jgi:hypothetical protein